MTSPTAPQVPAGWYPDPAGSGRSRWWDGVQWTEHFQEAYTSAPALTLRAPEGTNPNTPWIWGIVAVVVVNALPRFFSNPFSVSWTTGDTISLAIGILAFAAFVVLAYFDYQELVRRGVPKPFHWAWMFFAMITPLVYLIGRAVVVQRRTGTGIAPSMVAIGLNIGIAIVASGVSTALVGFGNY